MMMESYLKDELAAGHKFESAADFYHKRIVGHSYIVTDEKMPEAEAAALKEKFRRADEEELGRLQVAYADKWSVNPLAHEQTK